MIREFEEAVKQIRARFVPDRELTQRLIAVAQRVIDDWVEIKRLEDNTMRRFANAPPSDDGHEEIESENQETKMKAQKINNEWNPDRLLRRQDGSHHHAVVELP